MLRYKVIITKNKISYKICTLIIYNKLGILNYTCVILNFKLNNIQKTHFIVIWNVIILKLMKST